MYKFVRDSKRFELLGTPSELGINRADWPDDTDRLWRDTKTEQLRYTVQGDTFEAYIVTTCPACDGSGDCPSCEGEGVGHTYRDGSYVACVCGDYGHCTTCVGEGEYCYPVKLEALNSKELPDEIVIQA